VTDILVIRLLVDSSFYIKNDIRNIIPPMCCHLSVWGYCVPLWPG